MAAGINPTEVQDELPLEGLYLLAHKIDEARQAANAIDSTSSQGGVYGDLSTALLSTLTILLGSRTQADAVYASIIEDGNSVARALFEVQRFHA